MDDEMERKKTLAKTTRAQIFTLDFLIAAALITLAIGFAIQTTDASQKKLQSLAYLQSNAADAIAQANVSNKALFSAPNYCALIRKTDAVLSDNCTSSEEPIPMPGGFNKYCEDEGNKTVFVARRIIQCPLENTGCLLEVRTCE